MAESSYERARRLSGTVKLNHNTGKYEYRDENWVMPEGHAECDYCGTPTPMHELSRTGEVEPTGKQLDTPVPVADRDDPSVTRYDYNEYRSLAACKGCA